MTRKTVDASSQIASIPPKRSPGRPSVISREMVIDAALALLEESGQNDLSVRSIARRLNTGKATLYNYFESMDAIREAVADKLIGELPALDASRPASLRFQLIELTMALFHLTESSYAVVAQAGMTPGNRASLRLFNRSLEALAGAGIEVERAAITLRLLRDFAVANSPARLGVIGGARPLNAADLEMWQPEEALALRELAKSPLLRMPHRKAVQSAVELVIDRMLPELLD